MWWRVGICGVEETEKEMRILNHVNVYACRIKLKQEWGKL